MSSEEQQKYPDICDIFKKCGGCQYVDLPYEQQLQKKQKEIKKLLLKYHKVSPIIGMESPYYYRNKVHAVFSRDRAGNIVFGTYQEGTHKVLATDHCLIEDRTCQKMIRTVGALAKSFQIKIYNEDTGRGVLRHVLVRRGFYTGEIMVILVLGTPMMPSKKDFVRALLEEHPEITTVVQNINSRRTSMVLGDKEEVLYGKGYIYDRLCGCTFRISPKSFYQVNPVQTEKLYRTAIEYADLYGEETVLDAYCGTGTIGIIAASKAGNVIGVELNPDAVRDARRNADENKVKNIRFQRGDAGEFMRAMASRGERVDVVFMDPPRAGSDERFLSSVAILKPRKVVYVSCNPVTLKRDLEYLTKHGYRVEKIQPVDMFPLTEGIETIVALQKNN